MSQLVEPRAIEHLTVALLAFVAGDLGTRAIEQYALARGMLDLPNARSAHSRPTPRGGGLAITVTVLIGIAFGGLSGGVDGNVATGLFGGGLLVAIVGWLDDLGGVRPRTRLAVHFTAACWCLAWIGGFPVLQVGIVSLHLGIAGFLLGAVGVVWGINFFNFMDGIDGLAGQEAVIVGGVGSLMLCAGGEHALGLVAMMIAGSAGGFLRWNWSPARIFMGDVGSPVLGFLLCGLAVASANAEAVPMITWGTLLLVFVFDATVTLARRVCQGHSIYMPHREFAFHRAVRSGRSHRRVCLIILALNAVLVTLALVGWNTRALLVPAALTGIGLLAAVYLALEREYPMYGGQERRQSPLSKPGLGKGSPQPVLDEVKQPTAPDVWGVGAEASS